MALEKGQGLVFSLECADKPTLKILLEMAGQLKHDQETEVKVVAKAYVPKFDIVTSYFSKFTSHDNLHSWGFSYKYSVLFC